MDFLKIAALNDVLHCPLQLCEKLRKSLRAILDKKSKVTYFHHLIPYNLGLRLFSDKTLCEFLDLMVYYLHAKQVNAGTPLCVPPK